MTKREKLQEALNMLFNGIDVDDLLEIIGNNSANFCCGCKYAIECDLEFFETNENGNFIYDEDGDMIVRDDAETCENILARHLDDEVD